MATMKLTNWTKPAGVQWPGIITDDKYIETITCGAAAGEFDKLTHTNTSKQDCTEDNAFIRVFKIQPSTHKVVIQVHLTSALSGARGLTLGAFGTIDETTEDALWARVPDTGIGAAIQQFETDSSSAAETNIVYNPFGVLTKNTDATATRGEFDHIGATASTDLSALTNDLHFFPPNGTGTTTTIGNYAQYVLNVDQLGYDYIAIRLATSSAVALTAGEFKFIVRQFN
jgi:hypothetical protein